MRFLLVALPASLAYEAFEVDDMGMSLLQLRMNRTSLDAPQPKIYQGAEPGPNPIVTMDDCRKKATALGLTLGYPPDNLDFEVPASSYYTKGCFCYRVCGPGLYADNYRWHAFYGTVNPGEDVTPEDAAGAIGNACPKSYQVPGTQMQQQRIDVPLHLEIGSISGECPDDGRLNPPAPAPAPADEGEAVGDPHIGFAGHHFDLDQSDVHH